MKERIKQLMEAQHMTQQNFAQVLGLNPATLSQILSGKANPTLNHVEAIRKSFPSISYSWLLAGEGPMFQMPAQHGQASGKERSLFTDDGQANVVANIPAPTPIYEPVPSKFESNKAEKEKKPERKIREIVVYYDNNTFETFVPKS